MEAGHFVVVGHGDVERGAPAAEGGGSMERTEHITLWIAAAVALVAAILIFQNYFIGQWLPLGEGGHKLVNLFGWVQLPA